MMILSLGIVHSPGEALPSFSPSSSRDSTPLRVILMNHCIQLWESWLNLLLSCATKLWGGSLWKRSWSLPSLFLKSILDVQFHHRLIVEILSAMQGNEDSLVGSLTVGYWLATSEGAAEMKQLSSHRFDAISLQIHPPEDAAAELEHSFKQYF